MKVLMLNGSPHGQGCTYTALSEIAEELAKQDIEAEIVHIGAAAVRGCMGCGSCKSKTPGYCVFNDDQLNQVIDKCAAADGLIIGSPVHYASASGAISSFCDRLFFAGGANLAFKPGAAVVSARRAGTSAALDQLNKYFTINNMPIVSSKYWNMVHGGCADDVRQDLEGLQIMRQLGRNMAWLLQALDAAKQQGIAKPKVEAPIKTSFIR